MEQLLTHDVRIDQYIEKALPFALPILQTIRNAVHESCPGCTETIKWGMPHFMYQGKILCSMAAFKQHCAFGFWLASKMKEAAAYMESDGSRSAMGDLGKLKTTADLPDPFVFRMLVQEAMYLIEQGVTLDKKPVQPVAMPEIPEALHAGFARNAEAALFFGQLSPGHKKEYLLWIQEAKTETTRNKRIETTLEWCAERKKRNWKYEAC